MNISDKQLQSIRVSPILRPFIMQAGLDEVVLDGVISDLSPYEKDTLYDAAMEALLDEAPEVKEYLAEQDKGVYPVTIRGLPGAYYVSAPEYDDLGVFSTLEEAFEAADSEYGTFFLHDPIVDGALISLLSPKDDYQGYEFCPICNFRCDLGDEKVCRHHVGALVDGTDLDSWKLWKFWTAWKRLCAMDLDRKNASVFRSIVKTCRIPIECLDKFEMRLDNECGALSTAEILMLAKKLFVLREGADKTYPGLIYGTVVSLYADDVNDPEFLTLGLQKLADKLQILENFLDILYENQLKKENPDFREIILGNEEFCTAVFEGCYGFEEKLNEALSATLDKFILTISKPTSYGGLLGRHHTIENIRRWATLFQAIKGTVPSLSALKKLSGLYR